ncbi:MAG: ABC transporter permease [bacterium]|nr:ABC transporter permease [bacterium]
MFRYIVRRIVLMVPTLLAISMVSFAVIELPPGDFVTSYVAQLASLGEQVNDDVVAALRERYGLGEPLYVRYAKWFIGILHGDLGQSLLYNKPVSKIILERLPWSVTITVCAFCFVWLIGLPIGVFSATHQYSIRDYIFTFLGFIGISIPGFVLAIILLWLYFINTGKVAIGLFSPEYVSAPWSLAKFIDLLKHLWLPAIILGLHGTAGLIRTIRANLLDELQKPYVMVARAKGLSERKLLYKYPFRIAINPAISTIGWILPALVGGELLISLVLGLPTLAPIMLEALMNQDMFLAGSIVMVLSSLTVIGTLISDLLLAWVDPRIRESV